jgi:GNAT superfamily N-acetyltransferase
MKTRDFQIVDGLEKMDFREVTRMLSNARWSRGIGEDEVRKGAENSVLAVGAFCGGRQVGYLRVISDRVRFAYLSDVYVDEGFRGNGIALAMVNRALSHESLKGVYQWLLRSSADELYRKAGFAPVSEPERWMEIRKERPGR